jgi:hypothetical protein
MSGPIAKASLIILLAELYAGFGAGFAPGWANGWPGGLKINQVWPAGMTAILFTILVTGTVGLGSLFGLYLSRRPRVRRFAGMVFGVWLMAGITLAIVVCYSFYLSLAASVVDAWPNGYNA